MRIFSHTVCKQHEYQNMAPEIIHVVFPLYKNKNYRCAKFRNRYNSREICCACARFPLKLEDFPEEITKCSWLFDNFECLFNLYNFFARDKDKVKCTLRFQCIEYLVCV